MLKKDIWIITDLGGEDYYPYIYEKYPQIKLILLFRNPIESIVASLYWRTFPKMKSNIIELIVRWNHSISRAIIIMEKYQKNVELYFYDEIFLNQSLKKSKILKIKNFRFRYDPKTTFFSFMKSLWYCPNKKYKKLLEEDQIALIKKSCFYDFKSSASQNLSIKIFIKLFYIRVLNKIFIVLSYKFPLQTKNLMNFYFSPIKSSINILKNLMRLWIIKFYKK